MTPETQKLYWQPERLTRFAASVVESFNQDGRGMVVLDQTAFYPTGGGQPCDTGRIGSVNVVDVEIGDDGRIVHRLDCEANFAVGAEVECEINLARRREMTQQHTGQHILSQAFFQLFGAETRGFRITDRSTEIDLALELQPEELESAILRAEELANSVVFDDREIRVHEVTPEQAVRLPLRKESFITDCIRVIEIADYDWSPCGGTHARRTGEVGLIAVRGWERAKKMTRVHFLCGVRAQRDYRAANQAAESIALKLTVGRDEAEASVSRLIEDNKRLSHRVRELAGVAAKVEAEELLESTPETGGLRVVAHLFKDRDLEEVKLIAHRLVGGEGVIALLAVRENEMVRLVFARSAGVPVDMNSLMKSACEKLGGRGGGKPDFAQGGGNKVSELDAALANAKALAVGRQ